jgi:ParB-like chromosome segregation protein Spo0J
VRRYIRLYELLPPIVVYQMTDGAYVLSDGHLRLLAAQRLGYRRVRVEIRQGDRDAVFANFVRSNATHGRQPTLEEVKGRVEILAAEGCSPATIAERLSLPVELVHRLPTLEDW